MVGLAVSVIVGPSPSPLGLGPSGSLQEAITSLGVVVLGLALIACAVFSASRAVVSSRDGRLPMSRSAPACYSHNDSKLAGKEVCMSVSLFAVQLRRVRVALAVPLVAVVVTALVDRLAAVVWSLM